MPIGVKDVLWVQQPREARARLARQELEKRGEVLRAHVLGREGRVSEGIREVGHGYGGEGKGSGWGRGAPVIEGPEGGAKQACEGVAQTYPTRVDADEKTHECHKIYARD